VLDRVRPTVVVRRRVYDVPPAAPKTVTARVRRADEDENSGPPSSANVAPALASPRVDKRRRLEEIVSGDEGPAVPSAPPIPTLRLGATIALADLASGMGIPKHELVTTLVTRGFFSITVKTLLPREMARTAAGMFGWRVEDDDGVEPAPKPAKRKLTAAKASLKRKTVLTRNASAKSAPKKAARRRG
jgi:hypothetical protein